MIEPLPFCDALAKTARRRGYAVHVIETVASYPISRLTRSAAQTGSPRFRLYLSSGIHGDEPAGPLAIQKLIAEDLLPRDIDICVLPLINPTGFQAQTRENAQGRDLNRDFRNPSYPETRAVRAFIDSQPPFDLSISLHEDWESFGFYMYALAPIPNETISRKILGEVEKIGPVEQATVIDGSAAVNGLISLPETFSVEDHEDWPETFSLYSRFQHPHFTMETPSSNSIEQRISMHIAATVAAIELVRLQKRSTILSE